MAKASSSHFLKAQRSKGKNARELRKRSLYQAESILADLFTEQSQFILDPYRRKSLLCPRRAGKTHVAIAYACYTALTNPKSVTPLITLTLRSAKNLYWVPLREFNEKYGLGLDMKVGDNMVIFPNGSRVSLHGADSLSDVERLRGGSYKLAIVDECKSIRDEIFRELIYEVLSPATNDATGTIAITGTPGRFLEGLFYEATCPGLTDDEGHFHTRDYYNPEPFWQDPPLFEGQPMIPRWSRHHWTVQANVFKPENWQNALEVKRQEKYSDDNPIWVREQLGRWVSTSDTMVYNLAGLIQKDGGPERCRAVWTRITGSQRHNKHGLPIEHGDDWEYVMGIDLGFNDHFAIVVMAYSPTHEVLHHVYEFKREHLIVPQMAQAVMNVHDHFDGRIVATVADTGGLGKLVVETLNQQHGLSIEAAEKSEKFDHIELFNSDMHEGKLRILMASELYREMLRLQWDFRGLDRKRAIRTGKIREDQAADNHLCDAALYTWRYCYHHFARVPGPAIEIYSNDWYEEQDNREAYEAFKATKVVDHFRPEHGIDIDDLMKFNKLFN